MCQGGSADWIVIQKIMWQIWQLFTIWKRLSVDAPPATRVVKFLRPKVLLAWWIDTHRPYKYMLYQRTQTTIQTDRQVWLITCIQASSGYHDVTWCHMTSVRRHMTPLRRHVMSHDMIFHVLMISAMKSFNALQLYENNQVFPDPRPWTLTYDLDHQTHPRYSQGTLLYQILGP